MSSIIRPTPRQRTRRLVVLAAALFAIVVPLVQNLAGLGLTQAEFAADGNTTLRVAGYAPALYDCARCSEPGPHSAVSVPAGGTVCAACRPAGAASPAPAALTLMVDLLEGSWEPAEASEPRTRREASGLVAAHLQWHLERGLRSLPLVERT